MTASRPDNEAIFHAARDIPDPDRRREYVREACGGDETRIVHVEALLAAADAPDSLLDRPAGSDPVATIDEPTTERPGTVIGPYKLIQQIGEGGMGTVWLAQQTEPVKRLVAVKLIKAGMDSKQVVARFEAERQALALMDHPNIARVLDGGTTSAGRPYFVMDLVKGVPITRYCDEHHLTPRQRLELFVPVCAAVQHAHQKGIIHRDLKPSNVLVALYDGKPVPKVIDFGVAKAAGQPLTDKTLVTGFGSIVGTLEYMSPEQAEINQLDIDTRSDIYSLGVLLYELLAGSPPFTRKMLEKAGMLEMLRMIREQEPSKPSTKLSTAEGLPTLAANRGTEPAKLTRLVRGELDWIVLKALEKDRSRRYETANGFAADVQRYLADEAVLACPPSVGYRFRKFARRNKGGLAVAALVLFFLVLLGSGVGWAVRDRSAREAEAARQQAERQGKVAGQVESILSEVDRLEREQKWPEALVEARRAEAVVTGGEAEAETAPRVHERLRDLEFIDRLELIRMENATFSDGKFNAAGADRDYARAFLEYGVDVEELAVETSIERLKARPALAIPLAAALDDWVYNRRQVSGRDTAGWKRLVAVARGIDPEPLRDRVRAAWGQPVSEVQDDLRRLAESIHVRAHHPATLVTLARTLQRIKHADSAVRLLRDARSVYPEDFWLNLDLASALYERMDYEGAIRFNTAAVSVRPNSLAAHNNLGIALSAQKKLDEAIACFRKVIELGPKNGKVHYNLGKALFDQNKPSEAIAAFRRAMELDPSFVKAYIGLGFILHGQKNLDEAIGWYRKAIELDPKDASGAWGDLGRALRDLRDQKKLDETIAWCRKMIEPSPPVPGAYITLGDALARQLKPDEAIAVYRQGLERLPDEFRLHLSLAGVLWRQGKFEEAAASYRQAIKFNTSGNVYFHCHYLGRLLNEHKKPKEAIDAFRKAVEINPKYSAAHYDLGLTLAAQGQDAEAIGCYRKAVEADPKYVLAHAALGNALVAQKDFAGAATAFQEAAALVPNHAPYWKSLGVAQYRVGNLKAAALALEKSLQLPPYYGRDSVSLFYLSMAHGRLNEKEQARKYYDQAAYWRRGIGVTDEELRRLCAEASALLSLDVPPGLKAPPIPGPTLLKPAAGATLDNGALDGSKLHVWEFDWSNVPGATQYQLYVIGPMAKVPIINTDTLRSSSYRYADKGYTPYRWGWRWNVRALVNGIWTDWSEERTFDLAPVSENKAPSPKK